MDAVNFGAVHFGAANLGDPRRVDRLVHTADLLLQHPGGTFPQKLRNPADLKGFYRLLEGPTVTHGAVLEPHQHRTLEQMHRQDVVVLILHDTTVLDYSGLDIPELGQVGDGHGRGYYCHNSLAVTETGQTLGLVHQILHRRRRVPKGEKKKERRACPQRESLLWKRASAAIPVAPPGCRWVDVADRGADITEFLDYEEAAGKKYVARSQHNRRVEVLPDGLPGQVKLHDWARSLPPGGRHEIKVQAKSGQPARTAQVGVSWSTVTILPPRQPRGEERGVPLLVWVVRVWELAAPPGVEPLEWILLTNVSVWTLADARERVRWYSRRWVIEEFHKGQKTGCAIEKMQFTHADRLQPAIALLSVVAVALLQLRDASRDPALQTQPAERIVPRAWVVVLSAWRYGASRPLTVAEFFLALARLGGHQNRKHDHPPGWLILWRGWTQLQTMLKATTALGLV
jgi:hypothetical protein